MAFKTPIGTTPFRVIYGKLCRLTVELEHKAYGVMKFLSFDLKATGENKLVQLNDFEEIRSDAYENSRITRK